MTGVSDLSCFLNSFPEYAYFTKNPYRSRRKLTVSNGAFRIAVCDFFVFVINADLKAAIRLKPIHKASFLVLVQSLG